ncbi:predicted protein [Uncinocarpus reesii 1704]|uniref:BZIP domain-containing protein n=1 Tax=Uncinocarpus reesii (strain UAMH 1704) TaxID=336963 RepID=C4JPX9_UNCRE|nr:uncharacterized protein UREG_04622 [Uncinocarpus reesii 1704]EEP79776.1 predicted protein [Uncinocarpus reesii 1704]
MAESHHVTKDTRVRDNQRRSRARRKEYIRDLERRLGAFEKLGVQATLEVQLAGRKVAAENALLRSLLKSRGITDEEVEAFLKAHREPTELAASTTLPPPPYRASSAATGQLTGGQGSQAVKSHGKGAELQHTDGGNISQSTTCAELSSSLCSRSYCNTREERTAAACVADSCSQQQQQSPEFNNGQLTSCETAARIITTMRGDSDMKDARAELGCASESNCMVKNMAIFDLLDR